MEQSVQVQVLSAAPVLLFENYLGSSFLFSQISMISLPYIIYLKLVDEFFEFREFMVTDVSHQEFNMLKWL